MIDIIIKNIVQGNAVLIAEAGVNYYDIAVKSGISPMEAAKLMIKKAAEAGVQGIKFQTYKAETLASKDSPYYWDIKEEPTCSQYELFKKYDSFGRNEYMELADYAEQCQIEFLSTPFDIESADYLYEMMNIYKISSSDINNIPFIEHIARKDKPIMISVGASNEDEIDRAVKLIRKYNQQILVMMHCVLEYPTPYEHANLNKIRSLQSRYPELTIGYSDHTKPDAEYGVLQTAYNLGAQVIEKHFTLDKSLKGNDHYHAMDEKDAKQIMDKIRFLDMIRGNGEIKCLASEETARENARRSLVAARDIQEGEIFTEKMLTWKRPGTGITVDRYYNVIGCCAERNIQQDCVIKNEMIKWK